MCNIEYILRGSSENNENVFKTLLSSAMVDFVLNVLVFRETVVDHIKNTRFFPQPHCCIALLSWIHKFAGRRFTIFFSIFLLSLLHSLSTS